MGEKMSLQQVREQIAAVATEDDYMLQGWIDALDAHLTQPAQAVDVGALTSRLRAASDAAYCDYIRQLSATECLGWESKVSRGKFGRAELDAHNRAHELLGRHRAFSQVAAMLTAALPKDSNGKEGV